MAQVEVKCPECKGTHVTKHGKSETGEPRYQCKNKDCPKKTFMLNYANKGYEPGMDERIIKMAANGSGIRDTSRVLGISTQKVLDTLKKQRRP